MSIQVRVALVRRDVVGRVRGQVGEPLAPPVRAPLLVDVGVGERGAGVAHGVARPPHPWPVHVQLGQRGLDEVLDFCVALSKQFEASFIICPQMGRERQEKGAVRRFVPGLTRDHERFQRLFPRRHVKWGHLSNNLSDPNSVAEGEALHRRTHSDELSFSCT